MILEAFYCDKCHQVTILQSEKWVCGHCGNEVKK